MQSRLFAVVALAALFGSAFGAGVAIAIATGRPAERIYVLPEESPPAPLRSGRFIKGETRNEA